MQEKIKNDLKEAMRAKNQEELAVLRMLTSAIRNKEISLREAGKADLSDEQVMEVIKSEVKKRKDSIEAYEKAEREDLAEVERAEIKILEKYLPEQMSEEELEKIVAEVVGSAENKNFGPLMGAVMKKVGDRADGGRVRKILKEKIG